MHILDFPGGSDGKASAYNAGDPGSIPGSGRSPGEGNGNPLQYSCLENPKDGEAWVDYTPWGHKESDMTEQLHSLMHILIFYILYPKQWLSFHLFIIQSFKVYIFSLGTLLIVCHKFPYIIFLHILTYFFLFLCWFKLRKHTLLISFSPSINTYLPILFLSLFLVLSHLFYQVVTHYF